MRSAQVQTYLDESWMYLDDTWWHSKLAEDEGLMFVYPQYKLHYVVFFHQRNLSGNWIILLYPQDPSSGLKAHSKRQAHRYIHLIIL